MVRSYHTIYPENIAQFLIFYRTLSDGLCKQAVNDDERCQSFVLVFVQRLHKSFGNIDAITFLKPPDLTNRPRHVWMIFPI